MCTQKVRFYDIIVTFGPLIFQISNKLKLKLNYPKKLPKQKQQPLQQK
jgi:hypothetical protein